MTITHADMKKLQHVRQHIKGSGLFCFEKGGKYFLYREVRDDRNTLVLVRSNIDDFVRESLYTIKKDGS